MRICSPASSTPAAQGGSSPASYGHSESTGCCVRIPWQTGYSRSCVPGTKYHSSLPTLPMVLTIPLAWPNRATAKPALPMTGRPGSKGSLNAPCLPCAR